MRVARARRSRVAGPVAGPPPGVTCHVVPPLCGVLVVSGGLALLGRSSATRSLLLQAPGLILYFGCHLLQFRLELASVVSAEEQLATADQYDTQVCLCATAVAAVGGRQRARGGQNCSHVASSLARRAVVPGSTSNQAGIVPVRVSRVCALCHSPVLLRKPNSLWDRWPGGRCRFAAGKAGVALAIEGVLEVGCCGVGCGVRFCLVRVVLFAVLSLTGSSLLTGTCPGGLRFTPHPMGEVPLPEPLSNVRTVWSLGWVARGCVPGAESAAQYAVPAREPTRRRRSLDIDHIPGRRAARDPTGAGPA